MAKIFRKTRNPYVLCAITHSLTLTCTGLRTDNSWRSMVDIFYHISEGMLGMSKEKANYILCIL